MLESTSVEYILGEPSPHVEWEAAIVLQGPYLPGSTDVATRIFLDRNSLKTLIIVATYLPPDEHNGDRCPGTFLTQHERDAVDSGRLVYLFVREPNRAEFPDFWRTNQRNQNLQRLTSFVGIRFAQDLGIPVTLKCRADSFLGMCHVTRYLTEKYLIPFPVRPLLDKNPRGRLVISDHTKRKRDNMHFTQLGDHFIADFWMFGYTQDLLQYFDITSTSTWDDGRGIRLDSCSESHLAQVWMKDMGIPETIGLEELVSRYMAVAESVMVEFIWVKRFHDYNRYMNEGHAYLNQIFHRDIQFYLTHQIWLKLQELYAGDIG